MSAAAGTPDLTVVVVSYRCAELLDGCLASLAPQRADLALEVIVIDNASRDGTAELVADRHPWVEFLESPANVGFARATNHGLDAARGADVLLLNPDTVVPPGTLAACVRALHEHAAVGMLGCQLVQPSGALDHACKRGFPTPLSALWHFAGLTRLRPRSPRFAAYTAGHVGEHEVASVDAINGAFMLVRGAALRDVGPLDERFWMYGEDLDWCYRFWQRGWDVLYWPGATVVHVKGGSAKTRAWRTNKAFHHAMWLFYDKHYRRHRTAPVTAAVGAAIALRLGISALVSAGLRRMRPA